MMLQPPPSYEESVITNTSAINYCYKCGHKLGAGPGNSCSGCGHVLVTEMQPMGSQQPTYQTNPPVISSQPRSNVIQPSSGFNIELYTVKDDRLILDFEKVACCPWQTVGIDERAFDCAPAPLKMKGITDQQWKKWMGELMRVQKKAPSIVGCLCMFCFPGLLVQSTLCYFLCPTSMAHPLDCLPCYYGDWYTGLKDWMKKVNEVLNPLEMYAKLLTYKPHNHAPRSKLYNQRIAGKDHNYEMSFLAIALNRQACEKLVVESWDHGVNDGCTSGIGRVL